MNQMMKRGFLFIYFITLSSYSITQVPLGTWRSHLPYSNASNIAKAGNKVYCSTNGGLFYFNTSDNSIVKVSKEDGLSDSEISALAYSENTKTLIVAYNTGNIDFIQNNSIFNLADIKNKLIPGDKRINNISLHNETAYLACGFGIVVVNIAKKEIRETYYIGEGGTQIKINEVCLDDEYIYAATTSGIYFASLGSVNLIDFNSWTRDLSIPNNDKDFNTITRASGKIYVNYSSGVDGGDIVYYKESNNWIPYSSFQNDNCHQLTVWQDNIMMVGNFHVDIYDPNGNNIRHVFFGRPRAAFRDESGILWVADGLGGLIRNKDDTPLLKMAPNGPGSIFVSSIKIKDNLLYAVPGGTDPGLGNLYRTAEVNTFKNNTWTTWANDSVRDFNKIAIDPLNRDHFYIASWGYGLFEFENNELKKIFRNDNSTLETIIPGEMYYRLGGAVFDQEGNLWVTNSGVTEPVSILKKNGQWQSLSLDNLIIGTMGDIIITSTGLKWIILPGGRGLFVIDDNNTLSNPDDDRYKKIDIVDETKKIITNDVYSMVEDKNGYLWLGTNKGVLIFYNPGKVFSMDDFYAKPVIVPRNDGSDNADLLLGTETVTCIAVDGANRKWIGTRNAGVFLVSDDGVEQIHSFNAENSPLFSNSISDIAINSITGEVFFGTDKGIISFKGDATEPVNKFNDVYVYPNPVREDYSGDIAITGLVKDTHVKITDLNGNLVYETISIGGQAIWDGKNYNRKRVNTGIYLVFCSNPDGTLTHITKILFIH
jgi:ligand-binding sensor domain-containing protein